MVDLAPCHGLEGNLHLQVERVGGVAKTIAWNRDETASAKHRGDFMTIFTYKMEWVDKCGDFTKHQCSVSTNCNIFSKPTNVLFVKPNMLLQIPRLDVGQATEQNNCISPVVAPAVQKPRKRGTPTWYVKQYATWDSL